MVVMSGDVGCWCALFGTLVFRFACFLVDGCALPFSQQPTRFHGVCPQNHDRLF